MIRETLTQAIVFVGIAIFLFSPHPIKATLGFAFLVAIICGLLA